MSCAAPWSAQSTVNRTDLTLRVECLFRTNESIELGHAMAAAGFASLCPCQIYIYIYHAYHL